MHPILTSLLTSGTLLLTLLVLTSIEVHRGTRFFAGPRGWADEKLLQLYRTIGHVQIHFGTGAMRFYIHFFLYKLLSLVLSKLRAAMDALTKLQRHNRAVAVSVQEEQVHNHLRLIAEHKATNSLSEAQKRKLKKKSMGV